ncbi:hypothetical protein QQS21_002382 [Conoideocrella luteorostrata]|uniref:Uncharacterized protein n=1 Tax=Conoideocrella luteorostrata TaxID=1105319 RepID=A0AAJ0CZ95_9HYPO|nr:hypothetical protein QQS21_002382 [Conoideocrella luteorostrata]
MGSRLRQTGRRRPDKPGNQPTGSQKFGRGEIMPTAYAQADEERKRANLVIAEEYLGKPTDMGDNPFKDSSETR